MKVGLVWYFTVIANCVSIKYVEGKIILFLKTETFRSIVKRSVRRQRYDEFMADMIIKHSKAVALTIGLAATATIVIIATAVAAGTIVQCSLCYDQFIPESIVL
ncbi:unnamed protein product [Wuchereria bancrofti]|uniref:Uncharacterized protein n=1 Tax=Wuchereria bancrofti TaxID=6293 RepID=A0A3P7DDL8_WUCBA|nr:unnamed protein product [Wuchereria bancrofti]